MASGGVSMAGRPTLADVAKQAGVAASTASVVYSGTVPVSDATRARVLAAADELGYSGPDPRAASLRRGRSGIVGVVVAGTLRVAFDDPVLIPTMDGIAAAIAPSGAGILLLPDDGNPAGQGPSLETAPVDAVVLIGCNPRLAPALETLSARGVPVVVLEGDAGPDVPQIQIDSLAAQRTLASHVRSLGHQHVAVVALPLDAGTTAPHVAGIASEVQAAVAVTRERIEGVAAVFPDAVVVATPASTFDEGVAAGRLLLAGAQRPTAVLAQSDLLAAGVVWAAEEAGLVVPDDLSVTGFDGVHVDGIAPHVLTTMQQPAFEKGKAAGELLQRLLAGEDGVSIRFTCTFRPGNTTAPPHGAR